MKTTSLLLAALLGTALLGCAPCAHLRPDHGKVSRANFHRQHVYREPSREVPKGLDTEEAALVYARYRKDLGAADRGQQAEPARVLLLEETKEKKK